MIPYYIVVPVPDQKKTFLCAKNADCEQVILTLPSCPEQKPLLNVATEPVSKSPPARLKPLKYFHKRPIKKRSTVPLSFFARVAICETK